MPARGNILRLHRQRHGGCGRRANARYLGQKPADRMHPVQGQQLGIQTGDATREAAIGRPNATACAAGRTQNVNFAALVNGQWRWRDEDETWLPAS
jgi:hypothetical protein